MRVGFPCNTRSISTTPARWASASFRRSRYAARPAGAVLFAGLTTSTSVTSRPSARFRTSMYSSECSSLTTDVNSAISVV